MISLFIYAFMLAISSLAAYLSYEDYESSQQVRYAFTGIFLLSAIGWFGLLVWHAAYV